MPRGDDHEVAGSVAPEPERERRAVLGGGLAALAGLALGGRAALAAGPLGAGASSGAATAARVVSPAPGAVAATPVTAGPAPIAGLAGPSAAPSAPTSAVPTGSTTTRVAAPTRSTEQPAGQTGASSVRRHETPPLPELGVLHLLRRATYGPTSRQVDEATRLGVDAWLERQLRPSTIPDSACDGLVARMPELSRTIAQTRAAFAGASSWDVMTALTKAHIGRAVWSERQLLEVMVDFWSNHLNVTCPSSEVWDNRHDYERMAIRPHALGRFSDMLVAATLHPSMLMYLGNNVSKAKNPNENLGRELLELHTVGVDGGYTETDVRQSALVLTGLSRNGDSGEFQFRPEWHHVGPLRVMGWSHPNSTAAGGVDVARSYLRWLAVQPQTARTIARKLAIRFVGDEPSTRLLRRLTAVYLRADTDTSAVLRALFASREFRASEGQKLRRPFEDLVATVRALGTPVPASGTDGLLHLYWMAGDVGHAPLGWHPPNGYPDVAGAWASPSMSLGRWNMHMSLAAHWWPTSIGLPTATTLPSPLPTTLGALVDELGRRLLFEPVSPQVRTAICAFVDGTPTTPLRSDSAAATWRLPYLAALLLDSPRHATR